VEAALGGRGRWEEISRAVVAAIAEQLTKRDEGLRRIPFPQDVIAAWNDQEGRTGEEVLELFDDAIAAVRPQVIKLEHDLM
jgi:hypothetical protein